MEAKKNAKLSLDGKTNLLVIHESSIRQKNKSLSIKTTTKRQKPKSVEKCEKKVSKPFQP